MTASSFATTANFIIAAEGGYTDDPRDSGNWSSGVVNQGTLIGSNMGCGAPATIAYMTETQPGFTVTADWMKTLPAAIWNGMAESRYWYPLQGDSLPAGLDLSAMDSGWNIGIGASAKQLQAVLGAVQDGEIGAVTLGLIDTVALAPIAQSLGATDAALLQKRLGVVADGSVGPLTLSALAAQPDQRVPLLLIALFEKQEAYYRGLYNFATYGVGWLSRSSQRLTAALALHDSSQGTSS